MENIRCLLYKASEQINFLGTEVGMGTTRKLERYIIRHRLGYKALKEHRGKKYTLKKKSAFKRGI